DAAGNAATANTDESFTYDIIAPTSTTAVESVSGSGDANDGDVFTVTLNPSEAVGTPTCTFTDTSGAMADTSVEYGTVSSDSHTAAVTVHDTDANGAIGFSCTYSDLAGNAIAAAITAATSGDVTIDNTHPTLGTVGIGEAGANDANNGDDITLTFTGSETIGTPTCTIKDGAGATMDNSVTVTNTDVGGNVWTCVVETHDNDADGTVTFSIAYSDSAGNAGVAETTVDDGSSVTIDNTHPTWSSVAFASGDYVNAAEDDGNVNLVITTIGVENGQTVTATLNSAGYTCSTTDNACTAVITGAGLRGLTNGNSYTFSVAVSDDSGNAATADTSESFTYDITAPTSTTAVESTTGTGDANNGDVVTITLNPSEDVAEPVCTFTDGSGAMADTSVTYDETGDDSWTASVTVADGDDDGEVGFSCTYSDLAGNAIGAAITTASSGDIDIDNTHPTSSAATIAVSGSGNANDADIITLTLDPSEVVGTPTCTWTDGSGAMEDTSVEYATTGVDSHTAKVTVHNDDQDGAVGFSCTYSDSAGNAIASAITDLSSGSAITIDNTHPTSTTAVLSVNGDGNGND
ncbi:uncharacterized protein METZ01_LOCUS197620, partial [marine metagenome]